MRRSRPAPTISATTAIRGRSSRRPAAFEAVRDAVKGLGIEPAAAQVAMLPQNYVKLEGQGRQADGETDGRPRRPRRRPAGVVQLRHRGKGNRGVAGVRGVRHRSRVGTHRLRLHRDRRPRHRLVTCGAISRRARITFPSGCSAFTSCPLCSSNIGPTASPSRTCFTRPTRAARSKLGHARGVAMLAAVEAGLAVVEYTPAEIKRAVVGYGRAEKQQVAQMVKLLLGLDTVPAPHDASDALAVAICHVHATGPAPSARFRPTPSACHAAGGSPAPPGRLTAAHDRAPPGPRAREASQSRHRRVGGVGYELHVPLSLLQRRRARGRGRPARPHARARGRAAAVRLCHGRSSWRCSIG